MPRKYVDAFGLAVHCVHTGPTTLPDVAPAVDRGHLFVLVHGAGRNAGDWQRQLDGLGAAHAAVALDLPGHGRSPQVEGCASVEAYADVLDRVVERLALRRGVLVGWDLGAAIAAVAALRRPARWRGLVLVAPLVGPVDAATRAVVHDVVRGRRPQHFDTAPFAPSTAPDVMRAVWTQQVMTDPRVLHGDLLVADAFDWAPVAEALRLPTLMVAGADDRLTPPADAAALASRIAGARVETVADAGHALLAEQPVALEALLVGFAAEVPA